MISDNREHSRVSVFFGGDVYRRPDGERVGRAILKDVSVTGLRVETLESLSPGEQVFVDFQMGPSHIFRRVPVRVERVTAMSGLLAVQLRGHGLPDERDGVLERRHRGVDDDLRA